VASDQRREWDLNPRGACTPKAFQVPRHLWLESAAPRLKGSFVEGFSLPVAWIGLSRLEIMAKFMATEFGEACERSHGRVRAGAL
jgi:hypothetical protein